MQTPLPMTPQQRTLLLSTSQHGHDYPMQEYFPYAESDHVTALSIVECVEPGKFSDRAFQYPGGVSVRLRSPNVFVEKVKVIDSGSLAKGSTYSLVVQASPIATGMPVVHYPMTPGHRYLVFGILPKDGQLETPQGSVFVDGTLVTKAGDHEFIGLAAFETHANALNGSSDRPDQILNSVIDCIPKADRVTIERLSGWLSHSYFPGIGKYVSSSEGRDPFPASERIAQLAESGRPFERFKLYQILCLWCIYCSEQKWVDSIIDLAGEANAIDQRGWTIGGELGFSIKRMIQDPSYVAVRLDGNRWADIITNSQNDFARGLLLSDVPRIPDEEHRRKLAQSLLASKSDDLLVLSVTYFARLLEREDLKPTFQRSGARQVWTNREESIEGIRQAYKL